MDFEAILERNRAWTRGREARALPPPETIPLAVVGCYDPRLDGLLLSSLGLAPGQAFLLRTAGALLQPGSSALRSLGLAIYMFGVTDVLVLGHTSCRMARFDTSYFVDSFRKRGVKREAFGSVELREWVGAIADPRRGVEASIAHILEAPFLPKDLSVGGLVLDDTSGALEVVVRPGERPKPATPITEAEPPRVETPAAVPAAAVHAAEPSPKAAAAAPPADGLGAAADQLLTLLGGQTKWSGELRKLKQELGRQRQPLARLRLIERFAHAAAADSREIGSAFDRLKREVVAAKGRLDPEELIERMLGRQEKA